MEEHGRHRKSLEVHHTSGLFVLYCTTNEAWRTTLRRHQESAHPHLHCLGSPSPSPRPSPGSSACTLCQLMNGPSCRAASFKQLYRTRPARLPEPTCPPIIGRIRYSTSSVSGPVGRWARETPNHLRVAGYPLSNHSGRQRNSAHVIARDSRAMLTGHPFERQNITEASCLCDFFNGFSLPV
jgi:hypothetical protein